MKPAILIALTVILVGAGLVLLVPTTAQTPPVVAGATAVQAVRSAAELDGIIATAKGDVVLDFTAAWCGPCRRLAPQLEAFARAHPIPVFAIDVDEVEDLARRYGITSMPTLVHLRAGVEVKRSVGYRDAPAIAAWVLSGG